MSKSIDLAHDDKSSDPAVQVVDRFFSNKERHVDQGIDMLRFFVDKLEPLAHEMIKLQRDRLAALSSPAPVTADQLARMVEALGARTPVTCADVTERSVGASGHTAASPAMHDALREISSQIEQVSLSVARLNVRLSQCEQAINNNKYKPSSQAEDAESNTSPKEPAEWKNWRVTPEGAAYNSTHKYESLFKRRNG